MEGFRVDPRLTSPEEQAKYMQQGVKRKERYIVVDVTLYFTCFSNFVSPTGI